MCKNESNGKSAYYAKLEEINKVDGFDPAAFAVDYTDLETQESRKRLPVMIQMAWFRMKYPEGKIAVQVTTGKDCFVATAKVYPNYKDSPECYLAEATASRGYIKEKPSVSPREWAQTAAVGIALRNAGFGLQFSIAGDDFEPKAIDELGANNAEDNHLTGSDIDSNSTEKLVSHEQCELTEEEKLANAMNVPCPLSKFVGKTLGEVLMLDPGAIKWCATKFKGDESIKAAAQLICDYSLEQAAS